MEETLTIEEKPEEKKQEEKKKKRLWISVSAGTAAVVLIVSAVLIVRFRMQALRLEQENAAIEAMVHMEAVELAEYSQSQHKKDRMKDKLKEDAGKDAARALADAARFMIDGVHNRPPEIELTVL